MYSEQSKNPQAEYNRPPGYPQQPNMQPGFNAQYVQQPYVQPGTQIQYMQQNPMVGQSINTIRDWLPWSIVNLFVGWLFGGILPLIFSIICRNRKREGNAESARTMGTLALVFNILVTLGGLGGWIALIVTLAVIGSTCSIYYPYLCR
ncbi:unnamed protein product [Rotaria sp. Silwood2]|nr:unnamed protein product [Rotaria sp. Silwood2]CAF4230426.1 unnamed protein product [Rotaria sp. Silwood2]